MKARSLLRPIAGIRRRLAGRPMPAPSLTLAVLFTGRVVLAVGGWTFGGDAWSVPLWIVADATLLAAALVDLFLSPGPAHVTLRREVPNMMSLHRTHRIQVVAENRSKLPLQLSVWDEPPATFVSPPPGAPGASAGRRSRSRTRALTVRVEPQSSADVEYEVTPQERGQFSFGGYTIRFTTRLHLWRWQVRRPLPERVLVVPDAELLIRRNPATSRKAQAHGKPRHLSVVPNRGSEFERVREYGPDDESRRINWYATARRGKLMVNHYQPPRNELVMFVFDAGRPSRVFVDGGSLLDHAVGAGFGLGLAALQNGDHVGAIVVSDRVTSFLPPGRGARQTQALARVLSDARAQDAEPSLAAALRLLKEKVRKRSLVCVFTDLTDPEAAGRLSRQLRGLRPQHVPVCVSVTDPALQPLAAAEPSRARRVYEKAAALELIRARRRTTAALVQHGIPVVDSPPDRLQSDVVDAYLKMKLRGEL